MSALLLNLVLLACTDKPATDDSVEEADTDTDTDADSDTDSDADTDTGAGWASLTGTITDASGAPLTNVRVQACVEGNCRYDEPDENGFYEFIDTLEPKPAGHAFDVIVKDEGYAIPLVPIWFEHGEAREIDVSVPAAGAEVAVPETVAEELELVDGVHITLSQANMEIPFGVDGSVARAVKVEAAMQPPVEGIEGEVVAMWYLEPFDVTALDEGFAWWLDADTVGAAEGETFQAYVADYEHADWASAGQLTATDGKLVPDAGLPVLATLIVVK